MFLIDHDQPQIGEGQEQGRTRSHHHAAPSLGHRQPVGTPPRQTEIGMPFQRRRAEAVGEPRQPLRRQSDFGQQHQNLTAHRQGPGDGLEIDLGLARSGDAVQQVNRKTVADRIVQGFGGLGLILGQARAGTPPVGPGHGGRHRRAGFQGPGVDQPLDHRRRDARGPGQIRQRHRRQGGLQHLAARRRDFQIFGSLRDEGEGRPARTRAFQAGGHGGRQLQHQTLGRHRIGGNPGNQLAQGFGQSRNVETARQHAQFFRRHPARPLAPDHADDLTPAQRHLDEIAEPQHRALRHEIVERTIQGERQQHRHPVLAGEKLQGWHGKVG